MAQKPQTGRRSFLQSTAAGSAALLSAGVHVSASPSRPSRSALESLNIACIGTANRAAEDVNGVMSENIVAIVDVDSSYLGRCKSMLTEKKGVEPRTYAVIVTGKQIGRAHV